MTHDRLSRRLDRARVIRGAHSQGELEGWEAPHDSRGPLAGRDFGRRDRIDRVRGLAPVAQAAALGSESAKTALKRVECPYVIKDKNGKFVTNLCF